MMYHAKPISGCPRNAWWMFFYSSMALICKLYKNSVLPLFRDKSNNSLLTAACVRIYTLKSAVFSIVLNNVGGAKGCTTFHLNKTFFNKAMDAKLFSCWSFVAHYSHPAICRMNRVNTTYCELFFKPIIL